MKLFAGLDVSLEKTAVCIEDDAGTIIWEKKVDSDPEALIETLAPWRTSIALVGLEACPLSEWIYRGLATVAMRFVAWKPDTLSASCPPGRTKPTRTTRGASPTCCGLAISNLCI